MGLAAVALVTAATLIRWLPDVLPESDFAVIDIQIQNVLRGWQATGVYSRIGGAHPGPMYLQLLAPMYLLSGERHAGVIVAVVALNAACLVALLVLIRRFASGSLVVASIAVFGVFLLRVNGLLASAWNPHAALLPVAVLIVLGAAAAAGHVRLLPWLALVGSFAVQTHMAFVVPAAAVLGVVIVSIAVGWNAAREAGGSDPPSLLRPIAASMLVAVAI